MLIRHDRGQRALRFCYGAGPTVGYHHSEDTDTYVEEGESSVVTTHQSRTVTEWSYGLRVLVGAEWFLTENISVHAEYRAGWTYRNRESGQDRLHLIDAIDDAVLDRRAEESWASEFDGWSIASRGALVGVSLFF